jgi:hypothetical protein
MLKEKTKELATNNGVYIFQLNSGRSIIARLKYKAGGDFIVCNVKQICKSGTMVDCPLFSSSEEVILMGVTAYAAADTDLKLVYEQFFENYRSL